MKAPLEIERQHSKGSKERSNSCQGEKLRSSRILPLGKGELEGVDRWEHPTFVTLTPTPLPSGERGSNPMLKLLSLAFLGLSGEETGGGSF